MRIISGRKWVLAGAVGLSLALASACSVGNSSEKGSSGPIVIGSTLALTGPLAPTAIIHKAAGDAFIKDLNAHGGLLGRQVKWVVLDDESSPQKSAALYERLVSEEKVDVLMGPYGTANITAAMQVAERHNMFFPHDSGTLVYSYKYKWQFPLYASGNKASETGANMVFDAYAELPNAPKTVAFVVSKFAATNYLAYGHEDTPGAVEVAKKRGLDVVLDTQYDIGNTDWAPIAQRLKSLNPDLLYMESTGAEGANLITAMQQINYKPKNAFYQFPAPGPMLATGAGAEHSTTVTLFEPFEPYLSNHGAKEFVSLYPPAAQAAKIAYTTPDYQAAIAWAAWQTLAAGVKGCSCLKQGGISDYLLGHTVPTVMGDIDFDPKQNNYYGDLTALKQIQNGKYVVVHPASEASSGATIE